MNFKDLFSKNWPHLLVLALFAIITVSYFSPEYDGYSLKQHDVEQFAGMSQETQMFREKFGEEPMYPTVCSEECRPFKSHCCTMETSFKSQSLGF